MPVTQIHFDPSQPPRRKMVVGRPRNPAQRGTVNRAIIRTGRWTRLFEPNTFRAVWKRRIKMLFPNRVGPENRNYTLDVVASAEEVERANPSVDILKIQARLAVMEMVREWMDQVNLR